MATSAPERAQYERITVTPIAGALGAEIGGVDIADADEALVAEINRALLEHLVVFFCDQSLDATALARFGRHFGDLHLHPYIQGLEEQPEVIRIVKAESDTYAFGSEWHSDQMFTPEPAKATVLHAIEVPGAGGDTLFTNLYRAYETLSPGMQRMIEEVRTHNVGDRFRQTGGGTRAERYAGTSSMQAKSPGNVDTEAEHPLVRTHPESGRRALYLGIHTQRFADMTDEESAPLLDLLMRHATRPEFTCRFRWAPGSVAMWDNRCTQHLAINDYQGQRRVMHRITICGDRPR